MVTHAIFQMDHVNAVLMLPDELHRVLLGHKGPIGVHLQQDAGAGQQLLLGDQPLRGGGKVAVVVVIVQGDPLCLQLGEERVDPFHKGVDLLLGLQLGIGDDDILAANGLVIGNGLVQNLVLQLGQGGVGAGDLQAVFLQPALYILGRVAHKAGELHKRVAHFCHLLQRAPQVVLSQISHAVHLQSIFHNGSSLLCHAERTPPGAGSSRSDNRFFQT